MSSLKAIAVITIWLAWSIAVVGVTVLVSVRAAALTALYGGIVVVVLLRILR